MIRIICHMALHVMIPGAISKWIYPQKWKTAWLIMMAGMIIDLDHLLADPVFDPGRCSLSVHPLHSIPALAGYVILTFIPKTRIMGLGLMIHIIIDFLDCLWMRFQ